MIRKQSLMAYREQVLVHVFHYYVHNIYTGNIFVDQSLSNDNVHNDGCKRWVKILIINVLLPSTFLLLAIQRKIYTDDWIINSKDLLKKCNDIFYRLRACFSTKRCLAPARCKSWQQLWWGARRNTPGAVKFLITRKRTNSEVRLYWQTTSKLFHNIKAGSRL